MGGKTKSPKKPRGMKAPAPPDNSTAATMAAAVPGKTISADRLCQLSGLTDRRHRQLAKQGFFPPPFKSDYQEDATLIGLFRYLRERADGVAKKREALMDEELRAKKRENDLEEGLMVQTSALIEKFRPVAQRIKDSLRQKLVNEYPMAVAGLDVPQARIFGMRLEEEILKTWAGFFEGWKNEPQRHGDTKRKRA